LIGLIACGISPSDADEQSKEVVNRWLGDRSTFNATGLTDATRSDVLAELKLRTATGEPADQRLARYFLIQLGDRQTAAVLVNALLAPSGPGAETQLAVEILCDTTQPWLIPMLEPALMLDEPVKRFYGSVLWATSSHQSIDNADVGEGPLPQSAAAATCVQAILMKSGAFSEEVRQSALRRNMQPDFRETRRSIRQWWQQNKPHFEKQDYTAVTPLQPVGNDAANPASSSPALRQNVPAAQVTNNAPSSTPAKSESTPADSRKWKWPVVVAFVGVLLVVLGIWKRRQS
jgi:hypothetical protein